MASPQPAWSERVELPLTLDYQLLRSLVIYNNFKEAGQKSIVMNEQQGCRRIILSEPSFSFENGLIRFETRVFTSIGIFVAGKCRFPVSWEGRLVLYEEPQINNNWSVSFKVRDTDILDVDHQPYKVVGTLWNLIDKWAVKWLKAIEVNLAPPITDLKNMLEAQIPEETKERGHAILETLAPGSIAAGPEGIALKLSVDIQGLPAPENEDESVVLSPQERVYITRNWEDYDAYLVTIITALTEEALTPEERFLLREVLLDARYSFIEALETEKLGNDFVRKQFIESWGRIAPVFRRQLGADPSESLLGYLAFFTASDALAVFDRIGPAIGIEISANGLLRLAQLVAREKIDTLAYNFVLNDRLRKIFDLGEIQGEGETSITGDSAPWPEVEPASQTNSLGRFRLPFIFRMSEAWAAASSEEIKKLQEWIYQGSKRDAYVEKIKSLLMAAASSTIEKKAIEPDLQDFYRRLVIATAWQESCFRQFRARKGNISYIRSYNGTSVGLMQINERVWRGIYDRDQLRWNIRYNCRVGCEILQLYLTKYALRKMRSAEPPMVLDDTMMACVTYSMYNGGPRQFDKYLKRKKENACYASDNLFADKYAWVVEGSWQHIDSCLVEK
ncbi:MAG: lytic transglycosylase domain-containing protein [Deltaproteobacteria bacterium]|nr:lytic transglycosylase domain-containing protein [Deltaproteobacteria bacterium]